MPVVDFQPIIDAGAFYLYAMAIMKFAGPVFAILLISSVLYGVYRIIHFTMGR